jgi:transposase-like protein
MSEQTKPKKCPHCYSENTLHNVWGRTEYYSCGDCKKEIVVPKDNTIQYEWNPSMYGFSSTDLSITLPEGVVIKGCNEET